MFYIIHGASSILDGLVIQCFSWFSFLGLCIVGPVGLLGSWVCWARGSGGFCWVFNDKSPTLKGSDMPSVLGLVSSDLLKMLYQCTSPKETLPFHILLQCKILEHDTP